MAVTFPPGWEEEVVNVSTLADKKIHTADMPDRPKKRPRTCKLTEQQVFEIRWSGKKSNLHWAKKFDVSTRAIQEIKQYLSWKDVP